LETLVDFSLANILPSALWVASLLAVALLAAKLTRQVGALKLAQQQILAMHAKLDEQARLAALVEAAGEAMIGWSVEGSITSWNAGAERLLGYTSTEAKGQAGALLLVEDRLLDAIREGLRVTALETELKRKNGQAVAVSVTLAPIPDAQGISVGAVTIIRDIAETRQADSLTLAQRKQLLLFVEQAPVRLAMLDADMRYIAASRRWIADFGKGHDDLTGLDHYQLHPDLPERWKQTHRDCLAGAVCESEEDRWAQAGGSEHWIRRTVRPWLDGQGKIGGIFIFSEDITEQKKSEERIKQLNRDLQSRLDELQTVLDVVPVAIAIAYDRNCQRIRLNRAGEAMLGLAPGINASKSAGCAERLPFKVLRGGRELAPDELPIQYAAKHGVNLREVEVEVVRQDGKTLTLYEYASPLFDETGCVRGCVGVFVDITERKRGEEALRETDRRKDEFLAMLAHELRNPLAPIRNALQVMKSLGPKEPRFEWSREVIDRQISLMARLLDDLLDVARIMQGKAVLKPERIALAEVVERALETSQPLIAERGHDIVVTLPQTPCWLFGDPVRLAQALSNLLNNAAKYTGDGGLIRLSASREGDIAVIKVSDNGDGIAADMIARIFDLFAQADHSLAHAQGGLGLGLPLARQLAEMHGGSLAASSTGLGRGSEFTLRLPLMENQPTGTRQPAVATASPLRRLKVLVVDDYADTAETLSVWLRLAGHDVRSAATGAGALAIAARFQPHVVLLDIGLPDMDGYAVAQSLRENPATRQAVLVALTGYGQLGDVRRASAAGFDHHLLKPVPAEALTAILASVAPP
jgi:PAS domain S-box-containing protein